MWQNTHLLNRLSNILLLIALIGFAYWGFDRVSQWPYFKIQQLSITPFEKKSLEYASSDDLKRLGKGLLDASMLTLDINAARNAFEALPWVKRANFKRTWPNRIDISIEEYTPIATWAQGGVLTDDGHYFAWPMLNSHLVTFDASPDDAAKLLAIYQTIETTVSSLRLHVRYLQQNKTGAIKAQLSNGTTLFFGRHELDLRLKKIKDHWYHLTKEYPSGFDYIDLRYAHGMAIKPRQEKAL
jgi:cell division protein FtsQ